MENHFAPFTNNQGERYLRMVKVQQKISGCFISTKGAEIYCRVHSYLSSCIKNIFGVGESLKKLFVETGKWPDFIMQQIQI